MEKIVIVGSGGFGREVAWLIEEINRDRLQWDLVGFVDDFVPIGEKIGNQSILGQVNYLEKMDTYVVCAISDPTSRKRIINQLKNYSVKFATLIHPNAIISSSSTMGEGTIVCANSIITTNCQIGNYCSINISCVVGHDVILEDFVTLYPSVNISGNCRIEEMVSFGVGSSILQKLSVGRNTFVGAGAVVIKSLPKGVVAVGVPARIINETS